MDAILQQIFNLLVKPPGNLVFHLALIFSIISTFQSAVVSQKEISRPKLIRIFTGLGLLFLGQMILFFSSGLIWQGILGAQNLLPPLDRAITIFSLTWMIWLWIPHTDTQVFDAMGSLITLAVISFFGATQLIWIEISGETYFNLTWMDTAWQFLAIAILGIGITLLLSYPSAGRSAGLAMLLINLGGHVVHLFLADPESSFSALIRLSQLCSFPLLPFLVHGMTTAEGKTLALPYEGNNPSVRQSDGLVGNELILNQAIQKLDQLHLVLADSEEKMRQQFEKNASVKKDLYQIQKWLAPLVSPPDAPAASKEPVQAIPGFHADNEQDPGLFHYSSQEPYLKKQGGRPLIEDTDRISTELAGTQKMLEELVGQLNLMDQQKITGHAVQKIQRSIYIITGYIQEFVVGFSPSLTSRHKAYIEKIFSSLGRLDNHLNDLRIILTTGSIRTGAGASSGDFFLALDFSVASLMHLLAVNKIRIHLRCSDNLPGVACDQDALDLLLLVLVRHCVVQKACAGEIYLSVASTSGKESIQGITMDLNTQAQSVKSADHLSPQKEAAAEQESLETEASLLLMDKMVKLFGGTISAIDAPGNPLGARHVFLPAAQQADR